MLNFLPSTVLLILTSILLFISTIICFIPILFFVVVRLIFPFAALRKIYSTIFMSIAEAWIILNIGWMKLTQKTKWDVEVDGELKKEGWYLVTSNHQSWVDIFVLQTVLNRKIPFLKFFIKQELIKVPVMGICWWALDFPFMKRYSKAYLKKHPEMRGKDLEATKKACERFKLIPTSIMNFLEGTRFTQEKHDRQGSPFNYLLKPKSGGIAFAMQSMGEQLNRLLNVTIVYPGGIPTFADFLAGKVKHVVVRIEQIRIPEKFFTADYMNDQVFRAEFNSWVYKLWQDKDQLIGNLLSETKKA
ncbi:acyltransferase [Microbulbifer sp. THAF38]|uniref:acyltransferase n=1 Tax=Microbulbifer sp. THAF38 TaxID=2587856 RepID=UPI001268572B|nr:acyltransferase [Microbulbifer sp. THAF38]QFT56367.1 putative acyltransferase YihG [Microbulbifer sp. THAF38]